LNIVMLLRAAAGDGPCRIYMSDVKVRAADDVVYYPDVMVACGPERGGTLIEEAPCLVVEVTSPSSEVIDRREKLFVYKRLPGLLAYLVVDQERRRVDRHWRDEQGEWRHERVEESGSIEVPCPPTTLALDQVYARAGGA
jgi:Uma2 family endonuclease